MVAISRYTTPRRPAFTAARSDAPDDVMSAMVVMLVKVVKVVMVAMVLHAVMVAMVVMAVMAVMVMMVMMVLVGDGNADGDSGYYVKTCVMRCNGSQGPRHSNSNACDDDGGGDVVVVVDDDDDGSFGDGAGDDVDGDAECKDLT